MLNPDIIILSPSFKEGAVEIYAETKLGSFLIKIVLSNVSIFVLIDIIFFSEISFIYIL